MKTVCPAGGKREGKDSEEQAMKWHEIQTRKTGSGNEFISEARIPTDSMWFSGHFPGDPVLPGIAQLAMVLDTLREKDGKSLKIIGLQRIRFRKMIRPEDPIRIVTVPGKGPKGAYSFRILVRDDVVCTGVIKTEEVDP